MAPLGESMIVEPDNTKGLVIMATIEGVLVMALAVFTAFSIKGLLKNKTNK